MKPRSTLNAIDRRSLRSRIGDQILDSLLAGGFEQGRSVNEVALAAELGVSRTPVREALIGLTHEGFLRSEPGRGFFAAPLEVDEAADIYPMIWSLEALGLSLSPPLAPERLDELDGISADMAAPDLSTDRALALDRRWHKALLAGCPNRRLIRTLDTLKAQAYRYEYAFFRESGRAVASADQHREIVTCLRAGDGDGALSRLERNWRQTLDFLTPWLGARKSPR